MATELIQTSETSTTTFKNDALEVIFILHWRKGACVQFLKVYDDESARNLILILGLEMENIVLNLSKRMVPIWKFLRYWNNTVIMVVKTKLVKIIQFFWIMRW
jgi:hypothetical protein